MNNKILEIAQKHGDLAFLQGYKAAKQGIPKEDRETLSRMPEALKRLNKFGELYFNLTRSNKNERSNTK